MNSIAGVGGTSDISQIAGTDGKNMSIEDVMAMLFLRRAETLSKLATGRANQERVKLDDLNAARGVLARMTALKQDAGKNNSPMPQDMVDYCHSHNIDTDSKGLERNAKANKTLHSMQVAEKLKGRAVNGPRTGRKEIVVPVDYSKDEWGVNIQYLNTYIDKLSSDNDTFMIKLKSLVGKATNATEGANNVVTQKKQIMKDILTSFGR